MSSKIWQSVIRIGEPPAGGGFRRNSRVNSFLVHASSNMEACRYDPEQGKAEEITLWLPWEPIRSGFRFFAINYLGRPARELRRLLC